MIPSICLHFVTALWIIYRFQLEQQNAVHYIYLPRKVDQSLATRTETRVHCGVQVTCQLVLLFFIFEPLEEEAEKTQPKNMCCCCCCCYRKTHRNAVSEIPKKEKKNLKKTDSLTRRVDPVAGRQPLPDRSRTAGSPTYIR